MSRWHASAAFLAMSGACFFELADPVGPAATGGAGGVGAGGGSGGEGGAPSGWWDTDFARRSVLSFADVGALEDVAVAVVLDDTRIDYAAAHAFARDLRFIDGDGVTVLPYEIERWDPSGRSLVWVLVPELSASDRMFMYYGNASAQPAQDARAVWARERAVYHFAEPPSAGSVVRDSTGSFDGVADNFYSGALTDGPLGPAYTFDGTRYVTIGGDVLFDINTGAATVEVVLRLDGSGDMTIAHKEGCCLGWLAGFLAGGTFRSSWGSTNCCSGVPTYDYLTWNPPASFVDEWHHIVSVWDRDTTSTTLYVDGVQQGQEAIAGTALAGQGVFRIGADYSGLSGLIGTIEEARFSPTAYDAARAQVHDAVMRDALISYGSIESLP